MRPIHRLCITAAVTALAAASVQADVGLFEYAFNIDGSVTATVPGPLSTFPDPVTSLGSVSYSMTGAGSHYFGMFVDYELSENVNTFFNEVGSEHGVQSVPPQAAFSWEIDEPGFSSAPGDIYANFVAGALDNAIGKGGPDDVSMALAWNFDLNAGETAYLSMLVSEVQPSSGFYLQHNDPDSGENVYFSTAITIRGDDAPDTGSTLLMLLGAGGCLLGLRRRNV